VWRAGEKVGAIVPTAVIAPSISGTFELVKSPAKIPTDGGGGLGQNPFGGLSSAGLPSLAKDSEGMLVAPKAMLEKVAAAATSGKAAAKPEKNRGRVDIKRETGNRGGKTVTVVTGFVGIGLPEKEQLAKKMRAACGCGGTVKDGQIEIQGDQREKIAAILAEAGFRPVMAGG
jgi:translation initiation factor 1